ncbi:MAG: imidazoleglycerol-phosphate dehydratase HisB [Bacillota bacterium]|jgi:imidazoleglycerol-phosphate dehydratase
MRTAAIERKTKETEIKLNLQLDGSGNSTIRTGVGFFDHMLTHIAKHGLLDLNVTARGDLEVDAHHTVEDVGIVFGQAVKEAVGNKAGIGRYGDAIIPMDEALAMVAVDLSGRPYLRFHAELGQGRLGEFDLELVEEFFQAVAVNAGLNLHIRLLDGSNLHHCCEAIFKAFGRALAAAVKIDERVKGVPSTKGIL